MDLILLYQDNQRISDAATYQPLFVYHNQAEDTIGLNEHLFKLDFVSRRKKKKRLDSVTLIYGFTLSFFK